MNTAGGDDDYDPDAESGESEDSFDSADLRDRAKGIGQVKNNSAGQNTNIVDHMRLMKELRGRLADNVGGN